MFGGFSIYSSDEEEVDFELEDPGFPPDLFEESENEMEDPVLTYNHAEEQQRYQDTFNFVISVDVEEVSNTVST